MDEHDENLRTLFHEAKERMLQMGFGEGDRDILFADYPNWEEHLRWLLSATQEEIDRFVNERR